MKASRTEIVERRPDPLLKTRTAECVSAGAKIPIVPIEKSPPLTKFFSATDSRREEVRELLRGKDVNDIRELKRQGLSIQAISEMTGFDRKTIRRYLREPEGQPEYGPRPKPPSLLDAFKPYLEERLGAGVWNARVLLRELRDRNYTGGYTILTDWLRRTLDPAPHSSWR